MESAAAKPLIVIVGQTASGKSDLAMHLAQKFDGEIICADSQTLRRELNIGTAKPSLRDQELIRHHLLDIIGLYDEFTAAKFQRLAKNTIQDIYTRKKIPILVGGTGLYINSVIFKYTFRGQTNASLRDDLSAKSVEELQSMIQRAGYPMPENNRNPRHLIRTLESAGREATDTDLRPGTLILGLEIDKEILSKRIATRVDNMLEQGFVDEVKRLIKKYGYPPRNFEAIGYKIILAHMSSQGEVDQEAVKNAMNTSDQRYAKRQKTWFKRNQNIQWVASRKEADKLTKTFLSKFATIEQ